MSFDPVLLSRIQFAMTAGFHFIFPIISLGLVWLLAGIELVSWRTGNEIHRQLANFVGRLFALTFAMGVATGITMEFQFGTNWGEYSKMVGDIFGAPLAIEAIGFFFLESTLLGLYLFGRNKVPRMVHVGSIVLVAVAATMSAFWILVANSWQQTPAGYVMNAATGRTELSNFWTAVFNPSTLPRFFHTMTAGIIAGAFFLAGVSAYMLIKDRRNAVARTAMRAALIVGFIAGVAEVHPFGHMHAVQVARTQPEKLATIEGLYEGGPNAPSLVFGIPLKDRIAMPIRIPGLLSRMVGGSRDTVVQGRNDFAPEDLPPVLLPFVGFHAMVMLGVFFIVMMGYGLLQWLRGRLWTDRLYLYGLIAAIPLPVLACELGWMTAEVGRQPWAVYKILRTSDAVSRVAGTELVLFSLIMFTLIYALLGALYVFLAVRIVKKGPEPAVDAN